MKFSTGPMMGVLVSCLAWGVAFVPASGLLMLLGAWPQNWWIAGLLAFLGPIIMPRLVRREMARSRFPQRTPFPKQVGRFALNFAGFFFTLVAVDRWTTGNLLKGHFTTLFLTALALSVIELFERSKKFRGAA